MSVLRKNILLKFKTKKLLYRLPRQYCTLYKYPRSDDGYTAKPAYPIIMDLSKQCVERRKEESWYKKIERQVTIEEKLFEINVPRYWGWKCLMIKEGIIPFNSLNFSQFITRTHLIESQETPAYLTSNKELSSKLVNEIKGSIEDELSLQLSVERNYNQDCTEIDINNKKANMVVKTINKIILRELNDYRPHLAATEVDYNSRIEAFWCVGGIQPPDTVVKRKKADKSLTNEEINAPVDRWVQYVGSNLLQLRNSKPLQPVWDIEYKGDVPNWKLDPDVLGYENDYRHGTSIPGFWPGDKRDFSFLSYHDITNLQFRPPSYGSEDLRESLIVHGILASFGWLVPLAAYHGFSPFNEITYPYVTQTVLTNGKEFTFMLYQMNTNKVYSEFVSDNSKTNICWCSQTQSLYDRFENGKIMGLNEDVLSMMVAMYLVEPDQNAVNLTPFLGENIQKVADIEDNEKRCWLEKEFKHFSANRPRHRKDLQYELYEWERIYKVEHNTRPMDPRRRPFALNQHPYIRKMSDHPGKYIPRALRPDKDSPKWRQAKFEKTYYPQ